jgi:hypothetical protein
MGINGDRIAPPQCKFCDLLHTRRIFFGGFKDTDFLLWAYLLGEERVTAALNFFGVKRLVWIKVLKALIASHLKKRARVALLCLSSKGSHTRAG